MLGNTCVLRDADARSTRKTAVVFGVASEDSIAWAICQQLAEAGADLFLVIRNASCHVFQLKDKLPVIKGFYPLDVANDATTRIL